MSINKKEMAEWKKKIEGQKLSGESVDEFCKRNNISRKTYYNWNKRIKEKEEELVQIIEDAQGIYIESCGIKIVLGKGNDGKKMAADLIERISERAEESLRAKEQALEEERKTERELKKRNKVKITFPKTGNIAEFDEGISEETYDLIEKYFGGGKNVKED